MYAIAFYYIISVVARRPPHPTAKAATLHDSRLRNKLIMRKSLLLTRNPDGICPSPCGDRGRRLLCEIMLCHIILGKKHNIVFSLRRRCHAVTDEVYALAFGFTPIVALRRPPHPSASPPPSPEGEGYCSELSLVLSFLQLKDQIYEI